MKNRLVIPKWVDIKTRKDKEMNLKLTPRCNKVKNEFIPTK